MKKKSIIAILVGTAVIFAGLMIVFSIERAQALSGVDGTYTTDAEFNEGTLVGVEHETVHDQLQLSKKSVILPFIWVPNSNGNTISKVDTETGNELGRYRVGPSYSNPSRTTVDLQGNCWVGNRYTGTAVKTGLFEAGQCIDRNGNGTIETSQDLNNDGDITGSEILPWGQDECVLYEVVLIPGYEGTFVPGEYTGPYTSDDWYVSPRGFAVDASNNVWVGTSNTMKYFYIDGETGTILKTIDVSPSGHNAYGAVIDKYGILWSSGNPGPDIRLNPSTEAVNTWNVGHFVYGIGLDYQDHLFGSGWYEQKFSRINILTKTKDWTKYTGDWPSGDGDRGVVATQDNDVWIANSGSGYVSRYDNEGNRLATIYVGGSPTGVAVDAAGKVWAVNLNGYIERINPETNSVDLSKYIVGTSHYGYSDMTGIVSRTITTKIGTWSVVYDSGAADTPWGIISWTSDEPEGTSLTVKVRSSNDQINWSAWETASNGVLLTATPDGEYIQVETTFQIITGEVSPILYDLTVKPAEIEVPVDIKPQSCRNPLNVNDKGVLPAAILGTIDFDVTQVDLASVKLEGVSSLRSALEDVATPFAPFIEKKGALDCTTAGADGYMDLTLKFDNQQVVTALGTVTDGKVQVLKLTGNLKPEFGGIPIVGEDVVVILKKK